MRLMSDSISALSLRQLLLLLSPHEGREVLLGAEVAAMARGGLQPREEALVRVSGVGFRRGDWRAGGAGERHNAKQMSWRPRRGSEAGQGERGRGKRGVEIGVGIWCRSRRMCGWA